jgi:DNA invertase Pin-like site-specific DNA recombinase
MRTAAYARFSSDQQKATSIEDQIRVCQEYAGRHRWAWQEAHVYTDVSVSAASIEGRHGLLALLAAAEAPGRPFDVVLVDDSSRVARDLPDAVRTLQRLTFAGVRVVYISQGIDSSSEQAEVLVAVHGMVDGLYLREMSSKIKRGKVGQLRRGYATGGVTYGYRTTPIPDPTRQGRTVGATVAVEPVEADVVRRVFGWYAAGLSLPAILTRLHAEQAPAPRSGRGVWRVSVVRRLLQNQRYLGRATYGMTRVERRPGTRRKGAACRVEG